MISILRVALSGSKTVDTPYGKKKLDITYEIPYMCGYNKSGDTIYIDKRLDPVLVLKDGRKMDVTKYLIIHESEEKHLEDKKDYKYPYAHEMATKAERESVEADKYPWDEYQNYVLSEVKRLKKIDPKEPVPINYDTKPEQDTRDYGELKVICNHQKKLMINC